MKRRYAWLPALAAPITVLGHVLSEALASGRNLLTVAREPAHILLLIVALLALPVWLRAARSRQLGLAMFGFIAVTLLAEGNGLSAAALLAALAISAIISWLGGLALGVVADADDFELTFATPTRIRAALPAPVDHYGPYFAYVAVRGNRPPPLLLA